jgi:predicted dehydrogenase
MNRFRVAQVSQPAVSPISQSPAPETLCDLRVWKPAIRQTGKSALRFTATNNIHVSWLDPKKVRQIVVTGSKKMLSWDDLAPTGPVMIYDKGVFAVHGGVYKESYYVNYGDFQLLTKEGDVTIPHLKLVEPLRAEARHFIDAIRGDPNTLSGPKVGIAVVRALAAIQDSMDAGGKPVKLR